jgi:eukaryotic-like serine/threonine-protein kinase
MAYQDVGKLDLALPLFEEALKLTKAKLGPEHPTTLNCMGNLAAAYQVAGKRDLAMPLFEEALKLMKAKLGPDHPRTLTSMNNLGSAYQDAGKLDLAMPLHEETLKLLTAKLGPEHPTTLTSMGNLGKAYCDANQGEKAAATLKEFVAARRKLSKHDDPQFAGLLALVALELLKCRQHAAVEEILRECLAVREKTEPDAWTTFNTKSMLGGALLGRKKYADAEPLLLAGYEGMKKREKTIPPPANTRIPEALDRLIELYTATGKPDEVKRWQAEREKYPTTIPPPREKR